MSEHWLKTPSGVVVWEVNRILVRNRRGDLEPKIWAVRATGGFHGSLWLRNLKPAKRPKVVAVETRRTP